MSLWMLVTVDVAPEVEDAFNRWYDTEHLPQALKVPGILSGRRLKAVEGEPKYLAIYEIADERVVESPEFLAMRGWWHFTPHVKAFSRRIFRQIHP